MRDGAKEVEDWEDGDPVWKELEHKKSSRRNSAIIKYIRCLNEMILR